MLVKAGNGVVEGNTVIRPTFWPLQVILHCYSTLDARVADWCNVVLMASLMEATDTAVDLMHVVVIAFTILWT